jgi:Histidine kinase-, DNA gyrase B-, and HSP90-like ATPase
MQGGRHGDRLRPDGAPLDSRTPEGDVGRYAGGDGSHLPLAEKDNAVMTAQPSPAPDAEWRKAAVPTVDPHEPAVIREICHDLRQPVAAILMLVSAASCEPGLPSSVRCQLDQVTEQAEWLSCMLRQALDSGITGETPETTDLRVLIPQVVDVARVGFTGHLTINQASTRPLLVRADPVPLRRAVANLLSNAFHAAGPHGTVALRLRRRRGAAAVEIEDDGPGFGMVDPGHGIGLTITQRIAARYAGRVDIEDGAQGGTLARLWLPIVASKSLSDNSVRSGSGPAPQAPSGAGAPDPARRRTTLFAPTDRAARTELPYEVGKGSSQAAQGWRSTDTASMAAGAAGTAGRDAGDREPDKGGQRGAQKHRRSL